MTTNTFAVTIDVVSAATNNTVMLDTFTKTYNYITLQLSADWKVTVLFIDTRRTMEAWNTLLVVAKSIINCNSRRI